MQLMSYRTEGGVRIQREISDQPYPPAENPLAGALASRRVVLFSSSFEFPGRYTRWDMGFVDPPLGFSARGRAFVVAALNARGEVLLPAIVDALPHLDGLALVQTSATSLDGTICEATSRFPEEQRSRQPS